MRCWRKNNDNATGEVSLETFALADAIRGQSVQKALSASSARSVAKDPALAELVRKEQDLGKQINAQLGALNNALSSNARDEKVVKATNASIDKLRSDRDKVRQEINRQLPELCGTDRSQTSDRRADQGDADAGRGIAVVLFRPAGQLRLGGAEGRAGRRSPRCKAPAGEIESKVRKLREALEPKAAMISDIPAFDVALGYELYSLLLKPVEARLEIGQEPDRRDQRRARPAAVAAAADGAGRDRADDEPLFASYRNVPWLARTHAVTMVPSAAALRTLRQLPPGKPERSELIAFGDPYFSKEQAAEAEWRTGAGGGRRRRR